MGAGAVVNKNTTNRTLAVGNLAKQIEWACERSERLTETKSKRCDGMEFFKKLDSDLKSALRVQLRDLWTHTSTAIEESYPWRDKIRD